jgi:hypothetical protein
MAVRFNRVVLSEYNLKLYSSRVGRVSDSVTRHFRKHQRTRHNPRFCQATANTSNSTYETIYQCSIACEPIDCADFTVVDRALISREILA